jgi:hypothetical protein
MIYRQNIFQDDIKLKFKCKFHAGPILLITFKTTLPQKSSLFFEVQLPHIISRSYIMCRSHLKMYSSATLLLQAAEN